jgi:LAS superfamily LD-carboxypeptidase LdcB
VRTATTSLRRASALVIVVSILLGVATPAMAGKSDDPVKKRRQVAQQRADVASQLDVLKATDAQVEAALNDLQANVQSRAAELSDAKAAADGAVARLAQSRASEAAKQAEVAALAAQLHSYALDAFVQRTGGTFSDVIFNDSAATVTDLAVQQAYTRLASGHNADILDNLEAARRAVTETRTIAEQAALDALNRQKQEQALFAALTDAQNQQQKIEDDVQARIDAALSESYYLQEVDRQLADQIAVQQAALAKKLAVQRHATQTSSARASQKSVSLATPHGITVNAQIAGNLGRMLDAAAKAGIVLAGSGYRSDDRQIELRRQHCGPTDYDIYDKPSLLCNPPVARPGFSMHEQGLAVDFTYNGGLIRSHSSTAYKWLAAHAADYGFYNLPAEAWHWSVNGR